MTEGQRTKRRITDVSGSIDDLMMTTITPEGKELLKITRSMYEELRDISATLHDAKDETLKITELMVRLEKRMTLHEADYQSKVNDYKIDRAKSLTQTSMIKWFVSGFSALGVAMIIGSFLKFIEVEKSIDQVNATSETVREHSKKLYELEIKMLENMRVSTVESEVVDIKKKHLQIINKKAFRAMK